MVEQIQSAKRAVGPLRAGLAAAFSLAAILYPSISAAESPASKNKEGNRLFAEGRYEDAEKAYLGAAVNGPGRPEILYNLGNSLIKQKKYNPGVQALRQSMGNGDTRVQENSWYNSGNALFLMDNFKDAAEAFIQALRLDPADRDAKYNLELSLMQRKQQEQKQSRTNQKRQDSGQSQAGKDKERNDSRQARQREGSISREQAAQILDAVRSQELEEQRKLLERRAGPNASGKDW
jgi:tetratricopeptide (TPR) repeat protein